MPIDVYGDDRYREPGARGWDAGLDYLATIALAGGLSLGGLKYFPSAQRALARTKLGNILSGASKGVKAGLSSLFGGLSKVYVPSPHPAPSWGLSRPSDLTLRHELNVAIGVFRAKSGISGASVDEITKAVYNRATADVPIAYGQVSPLTVGDILAGNGRNILEGAVGATTVSDLVSQVSTLSRLPGFSQSLARQGINQETFWSKVPVGAFMSKRGQAVYNNRGGIRAALEDLSNVRFPFTNFKPFGTLIPSLAPLPAVTALGRRAAQSMFGAEEAIYAAGKAIPLSSQQNKPGLSAGAVIDGVKIQSIQNEGMAKAVAARMGILAPPTGRERPGWFTKARAMPKWQRWLVKQGRKAGIGAEWAGRESRIESIIKNLGAIARGDSFQSANPRGVEAAGVTPEGAFLRSLLHRPTGMVNSAKDLTWFERLMVGVGQTVKRPRLVDGEFRNEVAYGLSSRLGKPSSPIGLRSFGRSRITGRQVEYAATRGGESLGNYLNFQAQRPLWLLSEMTGLNIKPGANAASTLSQTGLKIALPAYMGYEALQYLEYKSRRILGVGPLTGAATAYTTARVGVQSALDAVGVTDVVKDIEEKYPGLIDSPASSGIRAGATALAGIWGARALKGPYQKMASIAGGTILGYMQLAGITKSASELSDEYTGKADVPIRSGRWWALGRQPFQGGRIERWQPSWYRQLWTRPTTVGRWGSAQESWRGSWLPTPENWMLLKQAYDPYYQERSHWSEYPYPETAGYGGDIPFIGPLVERSIGRLIKPVQRREVPVSASPSTPGPLAVSGLGWGTQGPPTSSLLSNRLDLMTGETIHRAFEWTGLPGFLVGAMRESVLGKDGWYIQQKALATSRSMASPTKDLYEMELGGALGLSEFPRRFMPKGPNYLRYNPLPNSQARWLPGRESVFMRDRESQVDLHTGSPLDVIERAEMRLPGAGWDVAHDNQTPGMYSALQRFEILAGVAPTSQAYKHYKSAVEGQIEMGVLSDQDTQRFVQVQNQVAEQMKSRTASTAPRYAKDAFRTQDVTVASTDTTTFTTYEHPGMRFHLAGVEGRTYAMEGVGSEYSALKRQMAELRGQKIAMTYGGYGPTTPAILGDTNTQAIAMGLGKKPIDDLDYKAKHGSNMFQRSYEWLIQSNLPGPLGYPKTKWFGEGAPIDEYKSFVRSGTWDTGWETPYQSYIRPWFNQATGAASSEFLERNQMNEYLDNFKFAKNRRLSNQYAALGSSRAEAYFERQAEQTMVGLDPTSPEFFSNIGGALPASERPYFSAFAGVTSERQQQEIMDNIPNNMKPVMLGVWGKRAGTGGFASPVMQRYAEEAQDHYNVDSAQRVADYFAHQRLPDGDYAGWSPGVDMDTIKVKMAEAEASDMYAMGVWPKQRARADMYNVDSPTEGDQTRLSKDELYRLLLKNKVRNPSLFMGFPNSDHSFLFKRRNSDSWNEFGSRARTQGVI